MAASRFRARADQLARLDIERHGPANGAGAVLEVGDLLNMLKLLKF